MTGIVYSYTSPRGRVYIGQTTNEKRRRETFLDPTQEYAGKKMEAERKKYPNLKSWKYSVLETVEEDNPDILKEKLTFLEAYHIIKNKSIFEGLNTYLADIDTICKNSYLRNYYSSTKTDYYDKMEVLLNIEPELFPKDKGFYYSETAYVNDIFWISEIKKRSGIFIHILVHSNKKELLKKVNVIYKSAFFENGLQYYSLK